MSKTLIQKSEDIYSLMLQLYPTVYRREFGEEMQYVFSELAHEAYNRSGKRGIILLWINTFHDGISSFVSEHIDNLKGGVFMKLKKSDLIMQNSVFVWVALATGLVLLVPFFAMQLNLVLPDPGSSTKDGINWTLFDFIVMGTLLFGAGSLFVLGARRFKKNRVLVGIGVALGFLWLWAELAVGVFTNWGS